MFEKELKRDTVLDSVDKSDYSISIEESNTASECEIFIFKKMKLTADELIKATLAIN